MSTLNGRKIALPDSVATSIVLFLPKAQGKLTPFNTILKGCRETAFLLGKLPHEYNLKGSI
jgi:hypothetical protein